MRSPFVTINRPLAQDCDFNQIHLRRDSRSTRGCPGQCWRYSLYTHMAPALTSLAHPVAEAGKIAAHLLLEQFAARDPLPAQNIMLSFDLRIRESCGSNPEPSGPFF